MYTSMHMAQWAARPCLASGSNRPARAQVNSGFFYSNAEQREQLVAAERAVTDDRVRRVIQLKQEVRAAWVDSGARCALRHGVSGSDSGCVAPACFWGDGRKATSSCLKLLSAAALRECQPSTRQLRVHSLLQDGVQTGKSSMAMLHRCRLSCKSQLQVGQCWVD